MTIKTTDIAFDGITLFELAYQKVSTFRSAAEYYREEVNEDLVRKIRVLYSDHEIGEAFRQLKPMDFHGDEALATSLIYVGDRVRYNRLVRLMVDILYREQLVDTPIKLAAEAHIPLFNEDYLGTVEDFLYIRYCRALRKTASESGKSDLRRRAGMLWLLDLISALERRKVHYLGRTEIHHILGLEVSRAQQTPFGVNEFEASWQILDKTIRPASGLEALPPIDIPKDLRDTFYPNGKPIKPGYESTDL